MEQNKDVVERRPEFICEDLQFDIIPNQRKHILLHYDQTFPGKPYYVEIEDK